MQTRFMRSNSMVRGEKRGLDNSNSGGTGEEDPQPDRKRPALASVIVEALKMDNLQKLCSSLEPILRRVVSEEVERALVKLGPTKLNGRSSPKKIGGPDGRNLQLQFRSKLSLPLFTGGKVEGENGSSIHIVLIDANTGHVITFGPQSSAKLDVVVLEGDFNIDDEAGWTEEEFESHIVKEREGKRPLLNGELQVTLKEGVGTLGELTFTDNSSWIRSRKFRLGLKGASGCFEGLRIREAKTDSFSVKDHRGELYKKHYPPALTDEVWRLEKIGKDGSFHKRLSKAGIHTVEDVLRLIDRDSQRLRTIMGSGMSNKMWEILVEHAKTCVLSGKLYVYYPDELRNVGVVFNNIYELSGLISNGQYHAADSLSDHQKVYVDTLVKKAYDNWMNVVEYDGKSLLSFTQNKSSSLSSSMAAPLLGSSQDQSNSSFDYQHKLPILPPSISTSPQSINTGNNTLGEFSESYGNRFPLQSQSMNQDTSIHVNDGFAPPHNALINTSSTQVHHHHHPNHSNLLALGSSSSSQSSMSTFQACDNTSSSVFRGSSSSQSSMSTFQACDNTSSSVFRGYDDVFSEEEIRLRSHEMLENDDMQHLLRFINMGSYHHHGSENDSHENSYQYTSSSSSPYVSTNSIRVNGDRRRSSGKAVVGWLKLKAALRWGIFIRKKAAEKRAQLVELD